MLNVVELPLLKLFHNFCILQALTKEVICANSGEAPQNSLAEHIMQKFIEVFHCWCLLLAIFKQVVYIVISVKALHRVSYFHTHFAGVMFSAAFYRWRICGVFSRASYLLHMFYAFHG